MPLWNKRAVSSGQTEETYKEQLQSLKQTVNNLGLVSEQFEGAAEGLTESSDKVGHGVQVLAEGASRQERDVLQYQKRDLHQNCKKPHAYPSGYGSGDCNYADTGSADAATE